MISLGDFRLGWLVGLLEGEGCFYKDNRGAIRIELEMTDKDVVYKAASLLGGNPRLKGMKHLDTGNKPAYRTTVNGVKAVAWMVRLYPYLSARRQTRIRQVLADKVSLLEILPLSDCQ